MTDEQNQQSKAVIDGFVDNTGIKYNKDTGDFTMTVDGKDVKVSPLEAASLALANRYKELSSILGTKVQEMQKELTRINETSSWAAELNAPGGPKLDSLKEPSDELKSWMQQNNINTSSWSLEEGKTELTKTQKDDIARAAKLFDTRVDQLSGSNDFSALSLKNATQKAEQAFSTADAIMGVLRQLLQGMAQRI